MKRLFFLIYIFLAFTGLVLSQDDEINTPLGTIKIIATQLNEYRVRYYESLGWLLCDGRYLEMDKQYKPLFQRIGNAFEVPAEHKDGYFKLPDLRGRSPIGTNSDIEGVMKKSGLSERKLGDSGGDEVVKLTIDQMPSHNHPASASNVVNPIKTTSSANAMPYRAVSDQSSNSAQITGSNISAGVMGGVPGADKNDANFNMAAHTHNINIDHIHTITTLNTGNNQPHPNMQPFVVFHFFIKAKHVDLTEQPAVVEEFK